MSIIKRKKNELQYLVLKYGQIVATGQYIEETIQAMADSWEDSLLTVDRKLAQYSQVSNKITSECINPMVPLCPWIV